MASIISETEVLNYAVGSSCVGAVLAATVVGV